MEFNFSEHCYQILDTMPQMVWLCDNTGTNVLYFNKQWYDFTGTEKETLGEGWNSAVHPDEIDFIYNNIQSAVREKRILNSNRE